MLPQQPVTHSVEASSQLISRRFWPMRLLIFVVALNGLPGCLLALIADT